jgi:hypothetical protein
MFDSGKEVVLNEQFNPNDSACILKEYLRSLPDPLLTRELYASFLAVNSKFSLVIIIIDLMNGITVSVSF